MDSDLKPSPQFGPDIVVLEVLGTGASSIVYKAKQPVTQREVAVKVFTKRGIDDEKSLLRFENEAKLLANLVHENIVRFYWLGKDSEGRSFFVMELAPGESLQNLIRREGALSELDVARIAMQLADALSRAHELNIIHRDIKPSNIMVQRDEDGALNCMLLDFGVSKFCQSNNEQALTALGQLVGTPGYAAPEQFVNKEEASSDLYSLACVMYESLTGTPPFAGENAVQTYQLQQAGKFSRLKDLIRVNAKLETIINILLSKEPQKRFYSAKTLKNSLQELIQSNSLSASTIPTRQIKKQHLALSIGSVLTVSLLIIVVMAKKNFASKNVEDANASLKSMSMKQVSSAINSFSGSRQDIEKSLMDTIDHEHNYERKIELMQQLAFLRKSMGKRDEPMLTYLSIVAFMDKAKDKAEMKEWYHIYNLVVEECEAQKNYKAGVKYCDQALNRLPQSAKAAYFLQRRVELLRHYATKQEMLEATENNYKTINLTRPSRARGVDCYYQGVSNYEYGLALANLGRNKEARAILLEEINDTVPVEELREASASPIVKTRENCMQLLKKILPVLGLSNEIARIEKRHNEVLLQIKNRLAKRKDESK